MANGVTAKNILCKSGYSSMIKFTTNSVICVKPSTAIALEQRLWGEILLDSQAMIEKIKKLQNKNEAQIQLEKENLDSDLAPIHIESKETEERYAPEINPKNFVSKINNKYFALTPGKTFVYESETNDGLERIEVTTLDEKRTVMNVETAVVWDRVWLDGKLVEDTRDWYAQDNQGNVWYFGEYSQEFEEGQFVGTTGSWEAGINGAQPGIIMKANPQVGDVYRQEYYQGVSEDMAEVVEFAKPIKNDSGFYTDCLKTKDWNPLKPKEIEFKYYCPQVAGIILEESNEIKVRLVDVGSDELMTNLTPDEAKIIALSKVSGQVTDISTEGYLDKLAYAVEILSDSGIETDVFVDIKTGKILDIET